MVLYGLTAYMQARGEGGAPAEADVAVNGTPVKTVKFDQQSLVAPDPVVVSVAWTRGRQRRQHHDARQRRDLLGGVGAVLRHAHARRAHGRPHAGDRA